MKQPDVQHQVRFGDDGFEVDESTESDLTDWGIVEPEPERETRYLAEQGSLEADTRSVDSTSSSEQGELFVEPEEGQVRLDGSRAERRCVWSDD